MIDTNTLRPLLPTFQSQGLETVFVVACCGRVYVGCTQATSCRTCKRAPTNHEIRTDGSDLGSLPQE